MPTADEDYMYKKYGINNKQNNIDKVNIEKTMSDIAYCREHLERINETREALFTVLDQLPIMHDSLCKMGEQIYELACHIKRLEDFLGLTDNYNDDGDDNL